MTSNWKRTQLAECQIKLSEEDEDHFLDEAGAETQTHRTIAKCQESERTQTQSKSKKWINNQE